MKKRTNETMELKGIKKYIFGLWFTLHVGLGILVALILAVVWIFVMARDSKYDKAMKLMEQHDYWEAIRLFQEVEPLRDVNDQIGNAYFAMGQYKQAYDYYRRSSRPTRVDRDKFRWVEFYYQYHEERMKLAQIAMNLSQWDGKYDTEIIKRDSQPVFDLYELLAKSVWTTREDETYEYDPQNGPQGKSILQFGDWNLSVMDYSLNGELVESSLYPIYTNYVHQERIIGADHSYIEYNRTENCIIYGDPYPRKYYPE